MNIKLFFSFYSIEMRRILSYRATFWVRLFLLILVPLVMAWYLWESIFAASGQERMGGFTFEEMTLYYLLALLVKGITKGGDRLKMSDDIYSGELTKYLLFPIDFFTSHYMSRLAVITFGMLNFVLGLFFYSLIIGFPVNFQLTLLNILAFFTFVLISSVTFYLLSAMIELIAFWTDSVVNIRTMMFFIIGFTGGEYLPISFFPEWAKIVVRWLPSQYFYWFPINILLGKVTTQDFISGLFEMVLWTLIICALLGVLWNRGKYKYTGVGI